MKSDLLHYYLLLQWGEKPLDMAKGIKVVKALKKQQMKVHKTNNDEYIIYDSFCQILFFVILTIQSVYIVYCI